jgi:O-antigen/teichoic acid export membrane protein
MKEKIRRLYSDTLFQNSFYLMLNTGVMAIFGFVFWVICAHLFSPSQIGVATGLISAMTLISYISLLGFNNTFVRVLPTSTERDNHINTGLLLSISVAVIVAAGYVFVIPYIAPRLEIIHENLFYEISFVAMVAFAAINTITDSIFVAYRAAKYNLLIDGGIMGGTKMLLPLVFISLGAYGIFSAAGVASALGMIASILFLVWKFDYKPRLSIHWQTFKDIFHYSLANYIANLLNIAPTLVLPLIVIDYLGTASAGYYYLAFMMANLLYAVAYSIAQSLFAEGSYGDAVLEKLIRRSLIILVAITIPAGIILALAGPFVLEVFGKAYSSGGAQTLVILALASIAVAAYTLGNVILRIAHQTYSIVAVNVVYFVTISGLALLWVHRGLIWIAVAWLVGNCAAAVTSFLIIFYLRHRGSPQLSHKEA